MLFLKSYVQENTFLFFFPTIFPWNSDLFQLLLWTIQIDFFCQGKSFALRPDPFNPLKCSNELPETPQKEYSTAVPQNNPDIDLQYAINFS